MVMLRFAFSLFTCILASTVVLANDNCDALTKLRDGSPYRDFGKALKVHYINPTQKLKYEQLKIELNKYESWAETGANFVLKVSAKVGVLSKLAVNMIALASPSSKRLSKAKTTPSISEKIVAKDKLVPNTPRKIINELAIGYVAETLAPCASAAKALYTFSKALKGTNSRDIDRARIKTQLDEMIDSLDAKIAKHEMQMKDKEEKLNVVNTLVSAIDKICSKDMNPEIKQPGTNLYWLRCPLGQSWNGSKCTGNRTSTNWTAALSACPAGYRLPTRNEITGLLGRCNKKVKDGHYGYCNKCKDSKTCSFMFSLDDGWYWSSSPVDAEVSWRADFGGGYVCWGLKLDVNDIRCLATGP